MLQGTTGHGRVLAALRSGDVAGASRGLADLLRSSRPTPLAARALAFAFLAARRPGEALASAEAGLAQDPADAALASAKAYGHALAGEFGPALAAADLACAAPPDEPAALDMLANALTLCQRPDRALPLLQRAVELSPGDAGLRFNLAAVARFLGRTEIAEAEYAATLRLDPTCWPAWRNRSELRKQRDGDHHLGELTAALPHAPPGGRVQLHYALAKELEDLGRHDEAFAHIECGAAMRRAGMRYDVERDIASIDAIIAAFDAAACRPVQPADPTTGGPIFIVGMPRTGSTLLDRMLSAHPQIQSLDELQAFGQQLVGSLRARGAAGGKTDAIAGSLEIDAAALGRAYLDHVAPLRDPSPWFIDKLPMNVLYAGLIARALPSATLVCTWRDPLDTCLAVYKTLFDEAYPFSYEQTELGRYFRAYARLVEHWRKVLPGRFQVSSYEDLTADPERVLARVLAPLGLEVHPDCLRPEANAAPSLTASASQVREPVHRRSVGLARKYDAHLGPLKAALGL